MTRLTLPRFGSTEWTTLAKVITRELGIPCDARHDPVDQVVHVDLSSAPRARALATCAFYLDTHPEIRWSVQ